jgi:hypothetical protein
VSDRDVEPDTFVRTALQLLPVPPHEDGFWTSLEAALAAEAGSASVEPDRRRVVVAAPAGNEAAEPEPAPVPVAPLEPDGSSALVPPALRKASNAVLLAVAAAAVVVVAIAGTTLLEEEGTQTSTGGGDAAALTELDTLVDSAQADSGTITTMSASNEEATTDAVLSWVEDLGTGDGEAAWAAMGPASKAHFGSQAGFEDEMTALAEGFGAWASAEPAEVLVTPVTAGDDGTIAVVTLVGDVEQEGTMQRRADAFPVLFVDGEPVLEPYASAGALEVVIPEPSGDEGELLPMETDEELVFVVPSGAAPPVLRLDTGEALVCGQAEGTELSDLEDTAGQRCAYLPEEGLTPGEHTVTVAFLGDDGTSITAESLRFEAA